MTWRVACIGAVGVVAGCQPRVVGEWWSVGRQTLDGQIYENHLVVERESAWLVLHALVPGDDPDELLLATGEFQGPWTRQQDAVDLELYCQWEGCTFDPFLGCTLDERLFCVSYPDFYVDPGDLLEFERVGPPPR